MGELITTATHHEMVKSRPEQLPEPTYYPFLLAISLLFIGLGLITMWILSAAGAIGFFISLFGWIKDLIYERRTKH